MPAQQRSSLFSLRSRPMKKVNPTLKKGYTFPRRIKQYMQGCDRGADNKIKSEYARDVHMIKRRRQ